MSDRGLTKASCGVDSAVRLATVSAPPDVICLVNGLGLTFSSRLPCETIYTSIQLAHKMSSKAALVVPALRRHTSTVIVAHGLGDR